jgi:alpha-beta hydrolase superfamily lysophospholipase
MFTTLIAAVALLAAAFFCIVFGGPVQPPAMESINSAFKALDYSALPAVSRFRALDGADLAFREYSAAGPRPLGSVVLVHGSSASSRSMHPMAQALAGAGYQVYALDVRGHGESGTKAHADYVGQLEADLDAFVQAAKPVPPSTLAGFSSGGGFVLRFAASPFRSRFGSYLLLSPFISQDSPTQRPGSGGWVSVGVPRIAVLTLLNAAGIRAFNHLIVTRFALDEEARTLLTPEYDFNLASNFRPLPDYMANLRSIDRPCAVLAGTDDEAFHAERFEPLVRAAGKDWPVQLLAGVKHIPLTLETSALEAVVQRVHALQASAN